MRRWMSAAAVTLMLGVALAMTGCGYHEMGAATHLPPDVQTLAVPMFVSKVQAYNTEAAFTQAVVRELNTRTNYRVLYGMKANDATKNADAVLRGTITNESVAPLTYDSSSGQSSSYLVMVTASVQLVAHDGKVLYTNDAFAWRQQYQSTEALSQFVQEDGFAVRRMARDFAEALVSEMLEGFQ